MPDLTKIKDPNEYHLASALLVACWDIGASKHPKAHKKEQLDKLFEQTKKDLNLCKK